MISKRKLGVMVAVSLIAVSAIVFVLLNVPKDQGVLNYTAMVVNVYPHDVNAYAQGLAFEAGFLFESTGLYGNSSLRRVDLATGEVLQAVSLQAQYFGEGTAIVGDAIVQLTWQSHVGFVYNKTSFALLREFQYPTDGWGLTYDGERLIMSDGSANLYFLDPVSFERVGQVSVNDTGPVAGLNELEYINGAIYANIYGKDKIVIISPENGQVTSWIDLTSVRVLENRSASGVLNGIAYDVKGDRLFVTGKLWSHVFEIKLITSE